MAPKQKRNAPSASRKRLKLTTPTPKWAPRSNRMTSQLTPGAPVRQRTREGVAKMQREEGLYKIIEKKDVYFRLMDLPAEIRMLIYQYALGLRMIHVKFWRQLTREEPHASFKYEVCKNGPSVHPTESEYSVAGRWSEGDTGAVPYCRYLYDHPKDTLPVNLLRVSKRVYAEAKAVLFNDNIYTFTDCGGFRCFLLRGPRALLRKEKLTKLVLVVSPKSDRTHFLNRTLSQLYLPHGSMHAPSPQFPSLRALQIFLERSHYPFSDDSPLKWSSLAWIYGLIYLRLENLERLSVVTSDYSWFGPPGRTQFRPNEKEQKEYEEAVQERLLGEWMGGDQDDIEEMRMRYEIVVRYIYFYDWTS